MHVTPDAARRRIPNPPLPARAGPPRRGLVGKSGSRDPGCPGDSRREALSGSDSGGPPEDIPAGASLKEATLNTEPHGLDSCQGHTLSLWHTLSHTHSGYGTASTEEAARQLSR